MDSDSVFPKCVVCSTSFRYRGPQPHLLPCLHPVCEDCLKSPEVTTLDCSVCLKSHDKDVGSFPVDDVVLGDVLNQTMKHRPSNFKCTNKMDGNQAMSWCQECEDYFCEHCHISHSEVKATRNHTMKWISDLPCTSKMSQSVCEKHGQRLDVYDKDCDCFICFKCHYEDHVSHGTDTANMFLSREQDVFKVYIISASEKKEKIISAKETVLAQARHIDEKAVSLRDTVQHTFSELRDVIDQREKEVLVELDKILDSMRKINDSRLPVLKSSETSCQTVLDYINGTLLSASPSQLHKVKSSITQAFESCIKADVPAVHKYEPCVVFSKQGLPDLKSLVSSFGGFMTSVTQTESPPEASLKTGLQMKLEADIDELQTQNREAQRLISALEKEASQNEQKVKTLQEDVSRLQGIVIQLHPMGNDKDTWLHVLGTVNRAPHVVLCPKMMFDSDRVNLNRRHINDKGLLVNTKHLQWRRVGTSGKMFKNYCGTCSISPLPSSGLVYWEVEADVELDKPLGDRELVLEVGVCGEDVMDSSHYIGGQPNSCSLYISNGENDVIRYIAINGKDAATAKVFENKAGTSVTLKYGVLVDTDKMAVSFLDTNNREGVGIWMYC
ncbi:E3 ubiquitin-protein ligase TRIM33-like [Haliotis rubra]|uniref:E3 ubiquitin-protein ligase TRIM33-like n=1 Tax=Haliotis rubra TaxID=36100 RepID=UPI001EE558A6|nr:E3 ubiquitin-protein ligase TRIM33-like [Haliotis rubra]XP_046551026.1 E3 ubiquitin-protein ligase TRIM33-like [Haliotis rubra]XP_046551027.1 E3 ubiquitin-protein ligase TRIM33-like [Haliotis rubra]